MKFLPVSAIAALSMSLIATPAIAICKSPVPGNGNANNNVLLAQTRAKNDWRDIAGNTYGGAYKIWAKSSGKNVYCKNTGTFPNKKNVCEAVSTPCN